MIMKLTCKSLSVSVDMIAGDDLDRLVPPPPPGKTGLPPRRRFLFTSLFSILDTGNCYEILKFDKEGI